MVQNIDLNVVVVDPSYRLGVYAAGLVDVTATSFFLNEYSSFSQPLSPAAPTPTTFRGYLGREASVFPYVIPLAGGAGDLAINDFGDAVPEPSSFLLAGLGGLTLFAVRRLYGSYVGCTPDPFDASDIEWPGLTETAPVARSAAS